MKPWRWIALFVVAFAVLLVARAPAALVTMLLPAGPIAIASPSGSLWRGEGLLLRHDERFGLLRWRWLPGRVLQGDLAMSLELAGDGIDVRGELFASPTSNGVANLRGQLEEDALLRLLGPYRLSVGGTLALDNVTATRRADGFAAVTGGAEWSGGRLAYHLQGRRYEAQLPPLAGQLETIGNRLQLAARRRVPANTAPLLTVALRSDGWFVASASREFIEMAGQPWQGRAEQHETVLEVEEKLF